MAVRNDFTAGEVLAAADLNDTFASKVDYALPVNAQTGTTYTFVAADAEKLTTASNAAAVTLTIPPQSSVTWSDNTVLRVVNYGAGAVTIDGGSGVTVTNTSSTIAQYGAAVAIRTGSDAWTVVPFGGGDVPAATVSSPAASGQYTDTGITYDYYTFTASGTLTVDTAGFADILVIGGGASGGLGGAGGGAGSNYYFANAYLSADTHTVTVGAGGAAVVGGASSRAQLGRPGAASRLGNFYGPTGGGGGGGQRDNTGTITFFSGLNGASGGGGAGTGQTGGAGVGGIGNDGGAGGSGASGGGGGGGAVGADASTNTGGAGGAGASNSITGSAVTRCGGGGGGAVTNQGAGGAGGGGAGANSGTATSGTANTGGGGGGCYASTGTSGAGGSGIVIVRVKV